MTTDLRDGEPDRAQLSRRRLLETLGAGAATSSLAGCTVAFRDGRIIIEPIGGSDGGAGTPRPTAAGTTTSEPNPTPTEAPARIGYGIGGYGDGGYGGIIGAVTTTTARTTATSTAPAETVVDGDVTQDTTWGDDEDVVVIESFVDIDNASILTILPGTTVRMKQGHRIRVQSDSALNAEGTADQPIAFEGYAKTPGYWEGIQYQSLHPENKLINVDIAHGGADDWANVYVGNGGQVTIQQTTLRESATYGLIGRLGAELPEFSSNTFEANEEAPVKIWAPLMTALDSDSTYAGGNANDWIEVAQRSGTADAVTEGGTWPTTNAPFWISGFLDIDADITVLAGATFLFGQGIRMRVQSNGSLSAGGAPNNPVKFLGSVGTPGYWDGIEFVSNTSKNFLEFVEIAHGGSGGWANVYVQNGARASVQNSTIRDSATYGIIVEGGGQLTASGNTYSGNADGDISRP